MTRHANWPPRGCDRRSAHVQPEPLDRRRWLEQAARLGGGILSGTALSGVLSGSGLREWPGLPGRLAAADDAPRRPRIAALLTVFHHRSHAHVLLENFLRPYLFNGKLTSSPVEVASFYVDQTPEGDMSRAVARQFGIPIYDSISEALCLGGRELAVDGVLSIAEHGQYPVNAYGQREYPRKRFFDEAVAVMRRSGRFVPLFNDKHFSYRWDWAQEMVQQAEELGIPLMAGSSVPLAQRRPPLNLPENAEIEQAISIHGGPLESYDFHALEVLQSLVEFRKGGETGIARVEFLEGEALWNAGKQGRWSEELAVAAMKAELGKEPPTLRKVEGEQVRPSHGILVDYVDGLRGMILSVGRSSTRWNFACKLKGEAAPRATSFYVGPWENRNLFKALAHAIQQHFVRRQAPYPAARTLLTTGALEAAMKCRHELGQRLPTPHLKFAYPSQDFDALRERGDSWKILTEQIPEPQGIAPLGGVELPIEQKPDAAKPDAAKPQVKGDRR